MFSKDDIITVELVKSKPDNTPISGLIYVKDYTKKKTKNGSDYFDGTVECLGSLGFKAWGNSDAFRELNDYAMAGTVAYISGKTNIYGGAYSLQIDMLKAADITSSGLDASNFFVEKYDIKAYDTMFYSLMQKSVSPDTYKLFEKIMSRVHDRFIVEYAANKHHDNVKGGLLAHTYKVLAFVKMVKKMYPELTNYLEDPDALLLGCALHDIGKVIEYTNGAIIEEGMLVTHHSFGLEILFEFKTEIFRVKGKDFYYRLVSVIEQHHGEFGENPRTLEAYIVHCADMFESKMQFLTQTVAQSEKGTQFSIDGFKLV